MIAAGQGDIVAAWCRRCPAGWRCCPEAAGRHRAAPAWPEMSVGSAAGRRIADRRSFSAASTPEPMNCPAACGEVAMQGRRVTVVPPAGGAAGVAVVGAQRQNAGAGLGDAAAAGEAEAKVTLLPLVSKVPSAAPSTRREEMSSGGAGRPLQAAAGERDGAGAEVVGRAEVDQAALDRRAAACRCWRR